MVERAGDDRVDEQRRLRLELVGQDHPGIVRDISHALALRGISIEELETETRSASMAGGTLFYAEAVLLAPQTMPLNELESALEALASDKPGTIGRLARPLTGTNCAAISAKPAGHWT